MTPQCPACGELPFILATRNHAEYRRHLHALGLVSDIHIFDSNVHFITKCWLDLGRELAAELRSVRGLAAPRTILSRSYYVAYNASKAVRFAMAGAVSLKGDDHRKVGGLPDDFPNVDEWASRLGNMYEHRLRADYDNWSDTVAQNVLPPDVAAQHALDFLDECEKYLLARGMSI